MFEGVSQSNYFNCYSFNFIWHQWLVFNKHGLKIIYIMLTSSNLKLIIYEWFKILFLVFPQMYMHMVYQRKKTLGSPETKKIQKKVQWLIICILYNWVLGIMLFFVNCCRVFANFFIDCFINYIILYNLTITNNKTLFII